MAGLNIIKCKRTAKRVKELKPDLIYLQETHLRATEEKYLENLFKGQIFHAPAKTKTLGIVIRIAAQLDFKVLYARKN